MTEALLPLAERDLRCPPNRHLLAELARCLGSEGISIEALIQKPPRTRAATVPVVVLTDSAREDALRRAVDAIAAIPAVSAPPHCIRVEARD